MCWKYLVGLVLAAAVGVAEGEVVEEETWYGADGKVVKTVKRTLTGAEARKSGDWEPAWVIRERRRGPSPVRYSSSNWRGYGSRYGGYGGYWGSGIYLGSRHCYPRRYQSGGFTGYYRSSGQWGFRYRSPGISLRYCR